MTANEMMGFIGTKAINAKPMTRGEYNALRGWFVPDDENPQDEGYLVEYIDGESNLVGFEGYVSWSPKQQFEGAYETSHKMSFSHALHLLKNGEKVARKGWNGKGMYILVIKGECITNTINDSYGDPTRYEIDHTGYEKGTTMPVLDAIYMKTADNKLVPWLASQSDLLTNDWELVWDKKFGKKSQD